MAGFSLRKDPRSFAEAQLHLVRAMERQSLLLAHSDGIPARIPGPQGGLVVAFTDEEAAQAWKQGLHSRAPAYGSALATAEWPRSARDGRKLWLELFEQRWIRDYLGELANALALMNLGYREDETKGFMRWRTSADRES